VIFDVSEADFMQRVVERSRELPVVVDFWADWCGPCKALGPLLERAVAAREGRVELAKLDVDANQALSQSFGIRGIPAVKAFRDGKVVEEFTGAAPAEQVERFLDSLLPSEADALVESGDEESLRRALELDPRHAGAATALARILLRRGQTEEALELVEPFEADFLAAGLAARARLALDGGGPAAAFEAWDEGDIARALEGLQEALAAADGDERDLIRRVMVGIFSDLGPDDELAREHRRRLSAALY
jgi:putative thioredoxin